MVPDSVELKVKVGVLSVALLAEVNRVNDGATSSTFVMEKVLDNPVQSESRLVDGPRVTVKDPLLPLCFEVLKERVWTVFQFEGVKTRFVAPGLTTLEVKDTGRVTSSFGGVLSLMVNELEPEDSLMVVELASAINVGVPLGSIGRLISSVSVLVLIVKLWEWPKESTVEALAIRASRLRDAENR